MVTKLLESNKSRKRLFVRMIDPIGFEVDLKWRVAKAGGNQTPGIMLKEQKDYNKLEGHEFP